MPLSFPSNPTVNQTVTINSRQYRFTGSVWEFVSSGGGGSDSRWDLFLPPAPTGLTATGGNAQVALAWTAPTVLAQTPITDYVVQFSTNSGSTWTTFSDGTSTAASATVTGLTNGTAYTFRVRAVNGVGEGAWSTASSSVTPSGAVFRAIPTMTGYTSPSGEVSGNHNQNPADATLWRAFDGRTDLFSLGEIAQLIRAPSNSPARSIQYAFPEGQKSRISGYSITTYYTNLSQWNFFGSDDLSTWTLLDSRSGVSSWNMPQQTRTFSLASAANYRAYRWVLQDVSDTGDNLLFLEMALIE